MSFLLLETGGRLLLESGGGALLLETETPAFPPGESGGASTRKRHKAIRSQLERDDEEVMRFIERFLASL